MRSNGLSEKLTSSSGPGEIDRSSDMVTEQTGTYFLQIFWRYLELNKSIENYTINYIYTYINIENVNLNLGQIG